MFNCQDNSNKKLKKNVRKTEAESHMDWLSHTL